MIPKDSLVNDYLPADYWDVFTCTTPSTQTIHPDDLMVTFWLDQPRWVKALSNVRNFLVRFVGLKGSNQKMAEALEQAIREGKSYGFVEVCGKNKTETVVLLKDKHLSAYISVHIEPKSNSQLISLTTLVHYHNQLGPVYFFCIKPFHKWVVKSMLKRSVKQVLKQKS